MSHALIRRLHHDGRMRMTVLLLGLVLGSLTGCGTVPLPYVARIRYDPAGIERLPNLEPVALYRIEDARGPREQATPTLIAETYWRGKSGRRYPGIFVYDREPVAVTVTRAFGEGLTARGFPLVDRTTEPFVPGQSQPLTRFAISGRVDRFWGNFNNLDVASDDVVCEIMVRVHDGTSGQPKWEQAYAGREGIERSLREIPKGLDRCLSKVVRDAVTDPNFIEQFRGSQ